jgi:AsmA protein
VARLFFEDIKVGQSQMKVALKNGVLKTSFDDIELYGGHGRGFITIDASAQRTATIGANMTVEGLDARPFLKDAAGFDKLSGKAKLTLAVAGQGASQLQLVETLNGKADLVFADGAVTGINVAGMVRGLSQGKLSGLGTAPSDKTDFSELGSTWTITNGVAQNQDLHLMSPLLRLTGAGTVALAQRQVDYVIRPRLVSSLSGQGGSRDDGGIEVPVKVQGPWDRLSYTPDLSGIMKDPGKALEQVKKIGEQLKGKDAGSVLKGILGNKGAAPAGEAGSGGGQQKLDTKGLLKGLIKP